MGQRRPLFKGGETVSFRVATFVALATALALPSIAAADVIDDIKVVGDGYTVAFSVPAIGVTPDHPHGVYLADSTLMTINGYSGAGSVQFLSNHTLFNLPTVILYLPVFSQLPSAPSLLPLDGPAVDTTVVVPSSDPNYADYLQLTLIPGVYPFQNQNGAIGVDPNFTLTITQEAATSAATPEPGTLALFSTGLVCGWGVLRRQGKLA